MPVSTSQRYDIRELQCTRRYMYMQLYIQYVEYSISYLYVLYMFTFQAASFVFGSCLHSLIVTTKELIFEAFSQLLATSNRGLNKISIGPQK